MSITGMQVRGVHGWGVCISRAHTSISLDPGLGLIWGPDLDLTLGMASVRRQVHEVVLLVLLAAATAVCAEQQPGAGESQYGVLLSWMEELGGELSGASLQLVPGMGVGVVAQVDLKVKLRAK